MWHVRELIPNTWFGKIQKRYITFFATKIITVSKEVSKQFEKNKTVLIYNGIDPNNFRVNSSKDKIIKIHNIKNDETIFSHISFLSFAKAINARAMASLAASAWLIIPPPHTLTFISAFFA